MVDMDEATLSPMVVPLCGTMVALCAMVVAFGDDGRHRRCRGLSNKMGKIKMENKK